MSASSPRTPTSPTLVDQRYASQAGSRRPSAQKQASMHRRTVSHAAPTRSDSIQDGLDSAALAPPPSLARTTSHTRSASLPTRTPPFDDGDDQSDTSSSADSAELASEAVLHRPVLAPLATAQAHMLPPSALRPLSSQAQPIPPRQADAPADHLVSDFDPRFASHSYSSKLDPNGSLPSATGSGGWWDVVSAIEQEDSAPWQHPSAGGMRERVSSGASYGSPESPLPLPPGAAPASVSPRMTPPFAGLAKLDFSSPPQSPPSPSRSSLPYAPLTPSILSGASEDPFNTAALTAALEQPSPPPVYSSRGMAMSTPTRTPVTGSPARTPLAASPARRTTSLNAGSLLNGSRPPMLDALPPVPPIPATLFHRQDSSDRLASPGQVAATDPACVIDKRNDTADNGDVLGLAITRSIERPRPPPVPITIHRPSFPSPSSKPKSSKAVIGSNTQGTLSGGGTSVPASVPLVSSTSASAAYGRHSTPHHSGSSPRGSPAMTSSASGIRLNSEGPGQNGHSEIGGGGSPPSASQVIQLVPVGSPADKPTSKSKLFTRSKSFASKAMGKSSSAGGTGSSSSGHNALAGPAAGHGSGIFGSGSGHNSTGSYSGGSSNSSSKKDGKENEHQNNNSPVRPSPGRWDRSMVADIMGPTATERRNHLASQH